MEGPTPVSALLHAATMVTAGVYLIIRMNFFFSFFPSITLLMGFIGALTAFYASFVGVFQFDIKKIIAYSTCSQLGYMFLACGLNNYTGALYHLFSHAFFKALLFLGAGSVIYSFINHEQDLRRYGSMINRLPNTYFFFFVGSISLIGFPFFAGFYSKEFIIEFTLIKFKIEPLFFYFLGLAGAFFTTFYSIKIINLTFFGKTNTTNKKIFYNIKENKLINFLLLILSIFTIFVSFVFNEIFLGLGNNLFFGVLDEKLIVDDYLIETLNWKLKNLPFFILIISFLSFFLFRSLITLNFFKFKKFNS